MSEDIVNLGKVDLGSENYLNFYIDNSTNDIFCRVYVVNEDQDFKVKIPWKIFHRAVEYQKSIPLHQRKDIVKCEKCDQYLHTSDIQRHMKAHG